jgi:hypothetical protein
MTLEKPPWGKPVEEKFIMEISSKYSNKEIHKRNLFTPISRVNNECPFPSFLSFSLILRLT